MKKSLIAAAIGAVIAPSVYANVVITEVVEGSQSNKAIEIANVGSSAITLDGYSLMIESNGAGDWKNPFDLAGITLQSGDTYVVANSSASDELKALANDFGTVTYYNGNDAISLQKDGVVVDILGNIDGEKFNENVTLKRKDMSPSTTYDATKFEVLATDDWTDIGKVELGSPVENILITEVVEGGASNKAIEIANVGDAAVTLTGYILMVEFNGAGEWKNPYDLSSVTLEPGQTYVIANSSSVQDLLDKADDTGDITYFSGDDSLALFKDGEIIDILGYVNDTDYNKDVTLKRTDMTASTAYDPAKFEELPKDNWTDIGNVDLGGGTPDPDPDPTPDTLISALQGDSWASPHTDPANDKFISDDVFTVEGVITAIQAEALDADGAVGFFMQDETPDSDPNTSDGIFVVASVADLSVGDKVTVTGPVEEKYGWTQIPATAVVKNGTGTVSATEVQRLDSDPEFDFTLERHEGMLVKLTSISDMKVSRSYSMDDGPKRFNMVLAQGKANVHPNQAFFPGTQEADQAADCNDDARLVVESLAKDTVGTPAWYPDFGNTDVDQNGSTEDFIRVGDRANNLQGVVGYSYSDYRIFVTEEANNDTFMARGNNRDVAPDLKEGDIRVATFNANQYFNSVQGGGETNDFLALDASAGAQSSTEFDHQTQKLVKALTLLNADIVGLMEIENNGFGESSAISYLVTQLNAELEEEQKYNIASAEGLTNVGELATSSYVIFRPSKVGLESLTVIPMPEQHLEDDTVIAQHDAVVPVFSFKDRDETLTLAVSHFADRGETCLSDDALERQGGCADLRVSAADYLGQQLADMSGEKIILGSLNAYTKEDAITVLTDRTSAPEDYKITAAANTFVGDTPLHGDAGADITKTYGYENVLAIVDPNSFNAVRGDANGSLDYILTSAGLKSKVVDATHWNINASESELLSAGYEVGQKYSDAFRSAQNDPVVLSIAFNGKPLDPVDPVYPDPDKPIAPGTPIELPSEPINEPRTETPVANGTFNYFVDLTNYSNSAYLKVGDEVSVSFSNADSGFVATSSNVQKDTLDQFEIALGWTEVAISSLEVGDYTVTTSVEGSVLETKQMSVTQTASSGSSGGSFGFGGLLSLLGLGFLRRRLSK
ncbi:ExeM/NucH family extracellular endonuclease [Vibrio cortegadensis]|uniref:ExeM/NucH family extracellular endonuclease n=1 Tax=Vibrio cortegadensis TaxID=1328770 RepID=UPI0021C4341E|nr:ExeM/NucH family extracellular endonuclease [Vibrio cortegadensis]MDN3698416.1 ExeM/NucH family extracellular endonuclease [Vibrio cortegadensis]